MSKAREFLSNIQGILIYLKQKNGHTVSLRELLEKDEETFKYILDDYNLNHESELKKFFESREKRIKESTYASLLHLAGNSNDLSDSQYERELEKSKIYNKELILKLPTKYQELHSFSSVNYLLEELLKASEIGGYRLDIRPEICTVSTNSVNACTLTLETGESVIIVEEDIMSFIHLFTKIFSQCLEITDKSDGITSFSANKIDIINKIEKDPKILERFKDFLCSYVIEGSPRKSKQYLMEADTKYWFCTYLMISAELFLVGHELGHIIAGHNTKRIKVGYFTQEDGNAINKNWEKELEADQIGMHLAMQAMAFKGFKADFCYLGIETFFIVQEIALKAFKILKDGNEDISKIFSTHPPNTIRRELTRESLRRLTSDENEYNAAIHVPNLINDTMEYLWGKTKDIFYAEYQKKLKQN